MQRIWNGGYTRRIVCSRLKQTAARDASPTVTAVIPGRDSAATLERCLTSLVAIAKRPDSPLREIIFVNDGSTDDTATIAARFPVRVFATRGEGAGAARNAGWRAATTNWIWFVDSDCVARPDALDHLIAHATDAEVGGISGTYDNLHPESLLACLIHEEIAARHARMPRVVNFLAGFNVLYRRAILERVGGFDPRYQRAQDAELSFRVQAAGLKLHFEPRSRVGHHHPTRWLKYFNNQRKQGYWRAWLHLTHPSHNRGDSYSSLLDHIQPPLALVVCVAFVVSLVAFAFGLAWPGLLASVLLLGYVVAHVPLTLRLIRRTRSSRYLAFLPMSMARSVYRAVGLAQGVLALLLSSRSKNGTQPE